MIRAFLSSRGGTTAIEYAIIAGLIGLAIVIGATSIGTKLQNPFNEASASLG